MMRVAAMSRISFSIRSQIYGGELGFTTSFIPLLRLGLDYEKEGVLKVPLLFQVNVRVKDGDLGGGERGFPLFHPIFAG